MNLPIKLLNAAKIGKMRFFRKSTISDQSRGSGKVVITDVVEVDVEMDDELDVERVIVSSAQMKMLTPYCRFTVTFLDS
jgi:hypothetical protein